MTKTLKQFASFALMAACGSVANVASATPFQTIRILGSTSASGPFNSSVTAAPGSPIFLQITTTFATSGTGNANFNGGTPITNVSGADGINSLSFNLADNAGGSFANPALSSADGWNAGTGAKAGTIGINTLTNIRPVQANGVLVGFNNAPVNVLTATLTAGSLTGTEVVSGVFGGTISVSRVNNGTGATANNTTENTADPYIGFQSLTISSTPEPASLSLLGLGTLALLKRRRNRTRTAVTA